MARTPLTVKREVYSDFHKDLAENPVSLDLARKINEEAVKESIKNLILTDRGERLMQPELGCDIRRMLFENMTPATEITMQELIAETLEFYEPRANIIGIDVKTSVDRNDVTIAIVFNVINSQEDILFTTTLSRIR
jgi:phage baseplate assembly protein W